MNFAKLLKKDLFEKCEELNISNYKSKKKFDIIELIENKIKKINISETNKNQTNNKKLNVLDLFCGCGGMSKGLSDSGMNIIAGIAKQGWKRPICFGGGLPGDNYLNLSEYMRTDGVVLRLMPFKYTDSIHVNTPSREPGFVNVDKCLNLYTNVFDLPILLNQNILLVKM